MKLISSICLVALTMMTPVVCQGQSPYQTRVHDEIGYSLTGVVSLGIGTLLKHKTHPFTQEEAQQLRATTDINGIDNLALRTHSLRAKKTSDIVLFSSQAVPLIYLVDKNPRQHFGQLLLLYSETVLITDGLTTLTKYIVRRPRPYVYATDSNPAYDIHSVNARASFVSGHTSSTAASTFFVARTFSDYYPDSRWKPVVWTAAAAIPAFIGYLRVRAGKHYPTDVLGGYLLGAAVGYSLPYLHR